jgi:hypothetical protein
MRINAYSSISFSLEHEEADKTSASAGELTVADGKEVAEAFWKEGNEFYFPALTTNSQVLLLKNISILAKAKDDPFLLGSVYKGFISKDNSSQQ